MPQGNRPAIQRERARRGRQGRVRDAPVCIDCHGEHLIIGPKNPASPLNAENISAETCGRCHGDPRLALRYDLPADRCHPMPAAITGWPSRRGK